MKLVLARHGQTEWNALRRFQGSSDVGLSALGRRQAEALGRALTGRRLVAAYVSPLRRARETAELACGGRVPLRVLPELTELCLGEWEGCTVDEIRQRDGDPYQRWLEAPLDCPPPGGEALPDVCARIVRAVDHIATAHPDGDEVLIVAHGGVISVYACHVLGLSFNALWRLRIDNGSLTSVELLASDAWGPAHGRPAARPAAPPRLVSLNDTAHLGATRSPRPQHA